MSTAQKIIKRLAIAFAIFLIVTIFYSLVAVGMGVTNIFVKEKDTTLETKKSKFNDISSINISLKYASLKIKKGSKLEVETKTTDNNIKVSQDGNSIKIKEKDDNVFKNKKQNVTLYIPDDVLFDAVNIETGAGVVDIKNLNANSLNLDLGVGKTTISEVFASAANIETGAGDVVIVDGSLNDASIEVGVGKLEIGARLTGNCKIESGIGAMSLVLPNKEDYKIKFTKGLGSISYDGENIANDTTVGDGDNYIEIDGGIGSINVTTKR